MPHLNLGRSDIESRICALKKYKFTPYEALGLQEDASHEEFSRRFWHLWDYSQPRPIGRTQEENEKARYIHERLEHIKEQMQPDEKYHIKV